MVEARKPLEALDFLAATLIQHDRELTALGDSLQESIQLLNKERFVEKYESTIGKPSSDGIVLEKMDEIVRELRALENKMQKLESRSVEFEASTDLSSSQAKTLRALSYEKKMSASEVMSLTGRSRALETVYLNQLVRLGLVEKTKKGRKHYYAKKILHQPLTGEEGSKKVMILVLVSENMSGEAQEDIRELVSHRLSDLKEWQLEQSTILSR